MTSRVSLPESMPVLSRGKHRNPRRGACFMEMASYLAGERWSDHPACTHPLLAQLARLVNDNVSDSARPQIAPLIPSVIGLTTDDLHVDVAISLRAVGAALPIAALSRQHVLATAVLSCERVQAELDGREPGSMSSRGRAMLDQVPEAEAWAWHFSDGLPLSQKNFRAKIAPRILFAAVEGLAQACVPDVEQRLVDLMSVTIADCQAMITPAVPASFEALRSDLS